MSWIKEKIAWIIAGIVAIISFYILGRRDGKKDEKLSKFQEVEKNVAKAVNLRNNVDRNVDGVRKKWKRSPK